MPDFLEYDPLTGVRRLFDYDEAENRVFIRAEQDVKPLLDRNQAARNERIYEGKDYQLACTIPVVVQLELRKKGIDIYSKDPSMIRRMFQEIEQNYPYLKTIDKKLG